MTEFTGNFSLFIGRYSPLHQGHIKLIRTVLDEGGKVCIGLRDTPKDDKNPYTIAERMGMFLSEFREEIQDERMIIVILPDIKEIVFGRKVGWGIRQIKLDEITENISATKIRKKLREKGK